MSRRWYHDGMGFMKDWVLYGLFLGAIVLFIAGSGAFVMWANKSGCEQKAASRPDIPVEWHWNTGCIQLRPDTTVVISG